VCYTCQYRLTSDTYLLEQILEVKIHSPVVRLMQPLHWPPWWTKANHAQASPTDSTMKGALIGICLDGTLFELTFTDRLTFEILQICVSSLRRDREDEIFGNYSESEGENGVLNADLLLYLLRGLKKTKLGSIIQPECEKLRQVLHNEEAPSSDAQVLQIVWRILQEATTPSPM